MDNLSGMRQNKVEVLDVPTFGQRLRELRDRRGLVQKEIAAILGVSESTIGKYENDQRTPSPQAINTLASYFRVSSDYLLGRSDDPTPPDPSKPMDVDQLITLALSVDGGHDALDERDIQEVREFIELVRRKRRMKREQQQGDDQK